MNQLSNKLETVKQKAYKLLILCCCGQKYLFDNLKFKEIKHSNCSQSSVISENIGDRIREKSKIHYQTTFYSFARTSYFYTMMTETQMKHCIAA